MPYKEQNAEERNISLPDFWNGITENYNSISDNIKFTAHRNRSNIGLKNLRKTFGKMGAKSSAAVSGGLTWLETGDWRAGIAGGASGYLTNEALQKAITAKIIGGHLQAGLARTSIGFLYGGALYDMAYNIPAHANDPTWEPSSFLADSPLFQFENYLVKNDKLAYKVYKDVQNQMFKEEMHYKRQRLKTEWGELKGKYIDSSLDKFNNFTGEKIKGVKEFFSSKTLQTPPSDILLKGQISKDDTLMNK